MKIAVFGWTGQVAQALAARSEPGCEVLTIGRDKADFTRPDDVAAAVAALPAGTQAVVNAVAYTAVDKAESEPEIAQLVNATSVAALARAAAARDLPLVHLSTDYVFDGSGERPRSPGDPTGPLSVYGRTKLAGEEAIRAAGGRHAILRTSWVFSGVGANFVKTMLRLGAERDRLTIVADQIGGPTPARAIAAACLSVAGDLALGGRAKGGTYHFSGAPDVSWAEFAREIFRQAGLDVQVTDIPTTDYPTPARRPLNSRLNCDSLERDFGIARPDWRAGLAQVLKDLGAT